MSDILDQNGLLKWYFQTKFEIPIKPEQYPNQFAIITAYNPKNQLLSDYQNNVRNKILEEELKHKYDWVYKINGFDETTDHKENGFMFNCNTLYEACKLGEKYSQDAIYYVSDNILFVSKCSPKERKLVQVGDFLSRIIK
ncbi:MULTISPECIES: DUF3293 domain-containing protein [unclassified Francisella]|uniref:DUF3293 domain-containing protein n=1 Tax=unclassified Francisella TaxID=2610885 RepID=UPI002E3636F1|nr:MULTISPECIES: DUF3293 domain-containing protein [unclassified Francisella]MED7818455.1 DUF3293 domain-containing protein [Francisella sp. 19S2-4]MED7829290.1 DUF3293 domain-containing protein [Francisella sp. 19S2-10]